MSQSQFLISLCTWYIFLIIVVACNDYKGFDDTYLFEIKWPGQDAALKMQEQPIKESPDQESLVVTTHNKEKYRCILPRIGTEENQKETDYDGPTPLELISTLFSSSTCSYRIESYWTYEVCHGGYIKQFHEEREGKSIKMQEYFLGKWTKEKTTELSEKFAEAAKNGEKFKTIRIDGVNLPYLEMEMSDGTMCDLNGQPRLTNVQYVCYPHGKNEVYSLKETSTCNYEVVILTPTLCLHPAFNPKEASDNAINCVPIDGAPPKPRSLLMMEVENMKKILEVSKGYQRQQRVSIVKINPKDGTLKSEIISGDLLPNLNKAVAAALGENILDDSTSSDSKMSILANKVDNLSPVQEFLAGKDCLTGGTGWWKYEFCYGRHVRQFHVDKDGETSLMLGIFDENLHREWIKKNPKKRPRKVAGHMQITHLYQGGSICDETGEKRQTEVQLKCVESASMSKVSLFLMEPKMCNYILGVESPLICEIINKMDEDGLVSRKSVEEMAQEAPKTSKINENEESSSDDDISEALESMFN